MRIMRCSSDVCSSYLYRRLAAGTEPDQRAVDAPDGTEQADEGRGGADRGQHGQAAFELHRLAGHALVQRAVDELGAIARLDQARAFALLVVRGGLGCVERARSEEQPPETQSIKR